MMQKQDDDRERGFLKQSSPIFYQRRATVCCCIIPGEIDDGGLETRIPVLGLTIGIAFRERTAEG